MSLIDLVFDPTGQRSMQLVRKLGSSPRRYRLMVAFVCSLGLLAMVFVVGGLRAQAPGIGLHRALVKALPACALIILGAIVLPVSYLVSLRRVGSLLVRLRGEASGMDQQSPRRSDRPLLEGADVLGGRSAFVGPISWAIKVASDKGLFALVIGGQVIGHTAPLVVIWIIVSSPARYLEGGQFLLSLAFVGCAIMLLQVLVSSIGCLAALRKLLVSASSAGQTAAGQRDG